LPRRGRKYTFKTETRRDLGKRATVGRGREVLPDGKYWVDLDQDRRKRRVVILAGIIAVGRDRGLSQDVEVR